MDGVLDRYEKRMDIDAEDRDRISRLFNGLWKNETVKSWFDDSGDVRTEVVVLPNQGETKRMDRA